MLQLRSVPESWGSMTLEKIEAVFEGQSIPKTIDTGTYPVTPAQYQNLCEGLIPFLAVLQRRHPKRSVKATDKMTYIRKAGLQGNLCNRQRGTL